MKFPTALLFFTLLIISSCGKHTEKTDELPVEVNQNKAPYIIAVGSCNDQERPQPLWQPIANHKPGVFIWGGDNVYADTEDMAKMAADYNKVLANKAYQNLAASATILGTWDDHDYGLNDGGAEWAYKNQAQTLLLDFLKYPKTDPLRTQEGVYHARTIKTDSGLIKIIMLDTRYFRTALKKSTTEGRRYDAWDLNHEGTLLGEAQWQWLEKELKDDTADFTLINTSIQFLSNSHGWEKWGNFPKEVNRMYHLLTNAKAKRIFMVSGDRHMAEISVNKQVKS